MSAPEAARASPPAGEPKPKDSKHKKEKKDKSESHRRHGHSKKSSKAVETGYASSVLAGGADAAAAAAVEEDWDENRAAVERLCAQHPNNVCCDCGENGTRWASVNHGVFVCIRCSGVHRSLGTHISKVKSTNMDRWSLAEVRLMEAIGNAKAKTLYEARLPAGTRPGLGSSGAVADSALKAFIQRKYAGREFAMHNLKDVLGRLYKETGYGRPPKKSSRAAEAAAAAGPVEVPVDRAAMAGKRGETMQALYGDAAAEMRQKPSHRHKKETGSGVGEGVSAESTAAKPTYGAFGLVNVPAEEYEQRWQRTLAAFAHVSAAAVAEEAAEGAEGAEGEEAAAAAAGDAPHDS